MMSITLAWLLKMFYFIFTPIDYKIERDFNFLADGGLFSEFKEAFPSCAGYFDPLS